MKSLRLKKKMFPLVTAIVAVVFLTTAIEDETKDPNKPIKNLQFQAAEINSVLTFLADYGGVNIVVSPRVEGSVTIKLNNVIGKQAMEIIGRTYGLAVADEDDGYMRVLREED